ncbi:MAG: ammonium transporter [Alphaproteobacteria bacterium]|nr:ammonium transporter [Alphaproteobacteria bacterium]
MKRTLISTSFVAGAALLLAPHALAADPTAAETGFLLNNLFVLLCGALVMFMAAGFAMLEAGMVRSKSVATICMKNISLYALAGIAFFLSGYSLMYGDSVAGVIGSVGMWQGDDKAVLAGDLSGNLAPATDWFFQMVFVATAASVVSGALAERVRFWAFAGFTMLLAGLIYPVIGHWTWGGGWLSELGFVDFAGSTIVHSVGGWAALVGTVLLGARRGRFDKNGRPRVMLPSSLPYVTLGTFVLWLGWFGFNGGSQLSFSSIADAVAVANIFVNTNAAAAGGVVVMAAASQFVLGRLDLPLILNGALAGLVSITAEPVAPTIWQAMLIGAAGALVMMAAARLLETLKLDDVVGAVPVHLAAGIWGTLAVALTNAEASFAVQAVGVLAVGIVAIVGSLAAWLLLKVTVGIRLGREQEDSGADLAEVGLRAHNFS